MHQHGYIGRKMRLPKIEQQAALVIAAFCSSSSSNNPLEIFENELRAQFPEKKIFWAYTSEILRKKMGLPSLQETLAQVEAAGFRRVVVQPLHIFPGTEYQQIAETCAYFPGMRVFLSETLLHRWEFIKETLDVVASEFLAPEEGLNLLALHGTPLAADPVNIVYLGMERLVAELYPNVLAASIEGIPDAEAALAALRRRKLAEKYRKIKIIPMMYLAGRHAKIDLMGAEKSWRAALEEMGFIVECATVSHGGAEYFKGLVYYPKLTGFFMDRLRRAIFLADCY